MSKISNAAKAASLLHHTWGVETIDEAVRLYDLIASNTTMHIVDILDKNRVGVWDAIDQLSQEAWWENVEMLALSIDSTRDYFEKPRTWVGLTEKEIEETSNHYTEWVGFQHGANWAQNKLKEKNT